MTGALRIIFETSSMDSTGMSLDTTLGPKIQSDNEDVECINGILIAQVVEVQHTKKISSNVLIWAATDFNFIQSGKENTYQSTIHQFQVTVFLLSFVSKETERHLGNKKFHNILEQRKGMLL